MSEQPRTWEFWGFESKAEGCPVQAWFDGLRIEAKEEIIDLVAHLRVMVDRQWRSPEFDPLNGEGGISELRPNNIRCEEGSLTYRIYGWRGYPDGRSYTFLHGTRKEVSNDREGKAIAKWRLEEIAAGRATVHRFDFEKESDSEIEERAGGQS